LPPITISLIQPTNQGVIYGCKRLYKKKLFDEVMVVIETSNEEEDTRGQNLKNYNMKSMIYNSAKKMQRSQANHTCQCMEEDPLRSCQTV
jgi:hypothetical protein